MKKKLLSFEYDSLTGLLNQQAFFRMTRKMLDEYSHKKYVFIRMDIDRFRIVNSFYGLSEGDRLIRFIGKLFIEAFKEHEDMTCCRMFADVFVMCMPAEIGNPDYIKRMIISKLKHFKKPYYINLSIGLYEIPDNAMEIHSMYDKAAIAAKQCKGLYDSPYVYYTAEMDEQVYREQNVLSQMETALENHEFQIYLQPKINTDNWQPSGAEALIRWCRPDGTIVPPNDFIPIFERNGFIIKTDFYVWEQVCRYLQQQRAAGQQLYPISVNVSRVNLYNPEFIVRLVKLLNRYNIPKSLLELELTESVFVDNGGIIRDQIAELHRLGFVIMMDDFGSGYSSLNVLKDISFDVLKIDMKFLTKTNAERGGLILKYVIEMARSLQLKIIVEGVETAEQVVMVKELGVNDIQGYYFARPMPLLQYDEFIRNYCQKRIRESDGSLNELKKHYSSRESFYLNFFESLMKELPYGILVFDKYNEIVQFNDAMTSMFGIEDKSIIGLKHFIEENNVDDILSEEELSASQNCLRVVKTINGADKYFLVSNVMIKNARGSVWGRVYIFVDDTSLLNMGRDNFYQKISTSFLRFYQKVFELDYTKGLIRRLYNGKDSEAMIMHLNDTVPLAEEICRLNEWIYPSDRRVFIDFVSEENIEDCLIIGKRRYMSCDIRVLNASGQYSWSNFTISIICQDIHNISYLCCFKDINVIKEAEHDSLSGLLERGMFIKLLEDKLNKSSDELLKLFVMIDIDYFKNINDDYGHQAGDEVIQTLGKMINEIFQLDGLYGRMGGDEFAIFIHGKISEAELLTKLEMLNRNLAIQRFERMSESVTLSIGCASVSCEVSFNKIYELADRALYDAKQTRNKTKVVRLAGKNV